MRRECTSILSRLGKDKQENMQMANLALSNLQDFEVIDISQPVTNRTAAFPGDTSFSKQIVVSLSQGGGFNLTAMTMSPHVGTHADAPLHIEGCMNEGDAISNPVAIDDVAATRDGYSAVAIGALSLEPFIGQVLVVDILSLISDPGCLYNDARNYLSKNGQSYMGPIELSLVQASLDKISELPKRVLFKTAVEIDYNKFEDEYAYLTCELVEYLAGRGVVLVGIDTPSVDHVRSKDLPAHHSLLKHKFCWLENLDLIKVEAGIYFLSALPLKLLEMEASPVRAVLLKPKGS